MFAYNKIDFHRNKVLKAELLQETADYTNEMLEHIYRNYSDGIIEGVNITVNDEYLTIHPGMIKYKGILYHMPKEEHIHYEHSGRKTFLRLRFLEANQSEEIIQYNSEFVLSEEEITFPYEMELGRFVAEKGAVLYADFAELEIMATGYNQFDIRNVPYAGRKEPTLSPEITFYFGKKLLKKNTENYYDIAFGMQCLNGKPVEREMIYSYLSARTKRVVDKMTNEEICEEFIRILHQSERESIPRKTHTQQSNRRIIVD